MGACQQCAEKHCCNTDLTTAPLTLTTAPLTFLSRCCAAGRHPWATYCLPCYCHPVTLPSHCYPAMLLQPAVLLTSHHVTAILPCYCHPAMLLQPCRASDIVFCSHSCATATMPCCRCVLELLPPFAATSTLPYYCHLIMLLPS